MAAPSTSILRSAASLFRRQAVAGPSHIRYASTAYPFSSSVTQSPSVPMPNPSPRSGTAVVNHINESLVSSYDPTDRTTLFSRRDKNRVLPGSVLSVVSYTSPAKTATSVFSGVLMGIRRRGVDTSFRVRTVVHKVGLEVDFKLLSPLIKEIRVVKRADGKSGLKNLGRAKVNYLRDRPGAMAQIASALKTAAR